MSVSDLLRVFEWHDLPVRQISIGPEGVALMVTPYSEATGEYRTVSLRLREPRLVEIRADGELGAKDLQNLEVSSFDIAEVTDEYLSCEITILVGEAGVWTVAATHANWSLDQGADPHYERRGAGDNDDAAAREVVWVFNGANSSFPSGVFTDRAAAERWILKHRLSGTLTEYPINVGTYDWALAAAHFTPKHERHRTAEFIGRFTSGAQRHVHYEDGIPNGS